MKKLFAFLLTFAMLFSLAMPAMAAEGDSLSTVYIDVGQLENAASVQSVWLSTETGYTVNNEPMTHVSGTIYSYDISAAVAAGDTAVRFQMFSGEGEGLLGSSYYTTAFEAGKNLWTATGENIGTWSVYGDDGSAGIPSAPSDDGNANDTMDVTATYNPDPEAKWGTDAENLTGSGTLAEAIAAATATDSTVGYIQLQRNVTTDTGYEMTSGIFTLDLNGKTLSNAASYAIGVGGAQVTLIDTATGGAVNCECGAGFAVKVFSGKVVINGGSYSGSYAVLVDSGSFVEINDGTFTGTDYYAVYVAANATVKITNGSFFGPWASIATNGTTTITGGSFTGDDSHGAIAYWSGTLNLSDYAVNGLTLSQNTGADMTVPNENIKLPEGYVFKDGTNTVTTLTSGTIYTIGVENAEPTYTITVEQRGEGTIEVPAAATEGKTVTVTLNPADGYTGLKFQVLHAENYSPHDFTKVNETTYTFVMPAANVVVAVDFVLPGTTLDTIYYKGSWTNIQFEFMTSTDFLLDVAVSTMVESGIYAVSDIPEWSYELIIRNIDDTNEYTYLVMIPTDGRNMYNAETGQWETYTPSQPPVETTSAEITWGSMSFTYDDTIDEATGKEKGWSNDGSEGAGTVAVTNTGDTTITASATYESAGDFGITGTLDEAKTLASTESGTFTLTLTGKPNKALSGEKIGTVTVTIEEYDPVYLNISFGSTVTESNRQIGHSMHTVRFYDANGSLLSETAESTSATETVAVPGGAVTFALYYKPYDCTAGELPIDRKWQTTATNEVPTVDSNVSITFTNYDTTTVTVTAAQ